MTQRHKSFSQGSNKVLCSSLGASLVEVVGALAVMSLISAGLVGWIDAQQRMARAQFSGLQLGYVLEHAQIVNNALLGGQLMDAQNQPLLLTSANPVVALSLPQIQQGPANFNAVNSFGQSYCLLAEQQADGSVQSTLLTVGGDPMDQGQLSDAAAVAGPLAGHIVLNDGIWQAVSLAWQRSFSMAGSQAMDASCGAGFAIKHLAALVPSNSLDSFSGSSLYRVEVPMADSAAKVELNTMQHDLSVRGDITLGVGRSSAAGLACTPGTFGRTDQGTALECLSATSTWSVVTGSGSTVTANTLGLQATGSSQSKAGLHLAVGGSLTEADNGTSCPRVGAMRRDAEGGVIACQLPFNSTTGATWKREGGAAIKWVLLESPIPLLSSVSPRDGVINIKSALASVANLDFSKLRLIKVKFSNRYAASNQTSQEGPHSTVSVQVCSNYPNVVTNTATPSEAELVVDSNVPCVYNLWMPRASDNEVIASPLGSPLKIQMDVMAYLCESENCQ